MRFRRYIFICIVLIVGLMQTVDAGAEKPDSAFGPEVWNREKELLASIDGVSNQEDVALTYLKLARIFRDNHRELTYLDLAEETVSKVRDADMAAEIMLLRLEYYAAYEPMTKFCEYAESAKARMRSMKDRRLSNVEYLVIKRHVDEGHTQTALATAREMLSAAKEKNDRYRQAYAYYSIGLIYQAVNRYGEAVDALEKSTAIMGADINDFPPLDYIKSLLELLNSQYDIGRYSESLKTCRAASDRLDKFIASADPDFQMGINCMSMKLHIDCYATRNYLAMNDLTLAGEHLHSASECMYPEIGLDREVFNETSAMYYDRLGDYNLALKYADMSVNAFRTSGLAPYYIDALTLKKSILADMGRWREAYENQALVEEAKDSLDASRFASELSELQTIYEVDRMAAQKKRQQVVLLFSVLCCALLLLVVIVFVVYYNRLRKKNQSLYEQINSNLRNVVSSAKVLQMTPEEELSREMQMFRRISCLMDKEKPYRDTTFNRTVLAKLLGTNEKYVADAVREGAGTTVSNYITDIRLNCSLELLSDESGDGEPMSLDDIARDSGFGSYSSFWRAFQKKYSMTPSEYRSLHYENA